MIFHSSAVNWASGESARRHHNFMIIISLIVICVALLLYYYSSRKFCGRGKILKEIASVSITAIIGIMLWIIAFAVEPSGVGGQLLNSKLWFNYVSFNNYSMFLLDETRINSPYVLLVFSLIPSITMYLGMNRKNV